MDPRGLACSMPGGASHSCRCRPVAVMSATGGPARRTCPTLSASLRRYGWLTKNQRSQTPASPGCVTSLSLASWSVYLTANYPVTPLNGCQQHQLSLQVHRRRVDPAEPGPDGCGSQQWFCLHKRFAGALSRAYRDGFLARSGAWLPAAQPGKENTEEDIDYVLQNLPGIVDKLRRMSPLYNE